MDDTAVTTIPRPLAVKAPVAAGLIGVSYATFRRLRDAGRIGPRAIALTGRSHVYVVDELRAWLRAGAPPRDRWEWNLSMNRALKTEVHTP